MVHWGTLDFQFAPMSLLQIDMLYIYTVMVPWWCIGFANAGLLVPLVHWFTWCTGAPVHWFTGSLVHWFTGALVHRFTGSPGAPVQWFTWCTSALVNQ